VAKSVSHFSIVDVPSQAQVRSGAMPPPQATSPAQSCTWVPHGPVKQSVQADESYPQDAAPASPKPGAPAVDEAPPPPAAGPLVAPASPASPPAAVVVASLLQATTENAPKPKKTVKQAEKARIIISSVEPKRTGER
jgi:hypothetical protein